MLQAAMSMINSSGLTVGLDHISFEDVIRHASVARSAAYRRWPYKDLFFSDLLKELARGANPAISMSNPETAEAVRQVILDHLDWVAQPGLRTALVAEVLRQGALKELQIFSDSPEWRTYLALQATFVSLADSELRTEIQASLRKSEADMTAGLAAAYERITELLGCRLRPELQVTYADVARLTTAATRGMVMMAPASPELATHTVHADPFGAHAPADWTQLALALAGIAMTFVEADPAVHFDEERIEALRTALTPPPQQRRARRKGISQRAFRTEEPPFTS
ncbi:hypothetical protein [Streptomyces sp. HUAS TT20]|uniref:hypothetical protein n=1 Tax=Streptomyces sp. HUAS TT20 TaxID=3447509 RepID=UPI0021D9B0FA|nr:hypothetical protein [Streptomyces sp. HUAS 15-9]UXY30468.1 hypothetical protein N8I87_30600 [Streptomyces sp. HUAS 15-9]